MANLSYSNQFKKIKEDIRQTTNKITRDLAKEVKKDMEIASHNIISEYYKQYVPEYYTRTHNLYNMFYFKHGIEDGIDNGHKASLTVASIGMFDNYNVVPDVVFDLVWNQGHRGLPFQNLTPKWHPLLNYSGVQYVDKTPDILMKNFLDNWGDDFGKKKIDKIDKKYISNEYKKFE